MPPYVQGLPETGAGAFIGLIHHHKESLLDFIRKHPTSKRSRRVDEAVGTHRVKENTSPRFWKQMDYMGFHNNSSIEDDDLTRFKEVGGPLLSFFMGQHARPRCSSIF